MDAVDHPCVTCDVCDAKVYGTRFKCLMCDDYDLCGKCMADGQHSQHDFLAIRKPHIKDWVIRKIRKHYADGLEESKDPEYVENENDETKPDEEKN